MQPKGHQHTSTLFGMRRHWQDAPVSSALTDVAFGITRLTGYIDSWTDVSIDAATEACHRKEESRPGLLEEVPRTYRAVTYCIGAWIRKDDTEQEAEKRQMVKYSTNS